VTAADWHEAIDDAQARTRHAARFDHTFPAVPDSVGQARWGLNAWLHAAFPGHDRLIGDVAQAVSEACNNAVVHAYTNGSASGVDAVFRLVAERRGGQVDVTVSDDGDGMTPRSSAAGLGLGLPLIAALSDAVKIGPAAAGRGTVVAMRFVADDRRH
jgi:serine/threonine-protein kinase RsbW